MTDPCSPPISVPHAGDCLDVQQGTPGFPLAPFIHRFQTPRQKYVYDVNTRRIIRVSSAVWDVLADYGCMKDEDIIAKHASHGDDAVNDAIRHIDNARNQQGLFLSIRPKEICPPDEAVVRKRLESQREQLILNVTEACNFRCSYCVYGGGYVHHRPHTGRAMKWDVAKAAIDDFLAHSRSSESRTISFYGGEPLLNLELIRQCVEHVRKNKSDDDVSFSMTTNGSLLRDEAARFVASEKFLIVISLDGSSDSHDRNRRTADGRPTWETVFSNIKTFLDFHPQYRTNGALRFSSVATQETDLCEAQQFWSFEELFNDSMGLNINEQKTLGQIPQSPPLKGRLGDSSKAIYRQFLEDLKMGLYQGEHCKPSKWVQKAVCENPFLIFHKRGYFSPHLPEKMVFFSGCIPGVRRTFVSIDGDYYACERVVQAPNQIIGNVSSGIDAHRAWELVARWSAANREQCYNCWCLSFCMVGCLATVGEDGSVTRQGKERSCARHRRSRQQLLKDYCSVLEENPSAFDYTAQYVMQ